MESVCICTDHNMYIPTYLSSISWVWENLLSYHPTFVSGQMERILKFKTSYNYLQAERAKKIRWEIEINIEN